MDWKRWDKHSIVQVIVLHRFGCLIEKTTNVLSAEILRRLSYGGADYITVSQVNNESFFPRARPGLSLPSFAQSTPRWIAQKVCFWVWKRAAKSFRNVVCDFQVLTFKSSPGFGDLLPLDGNSLGWPRSKWCRVISLKSYLLCLTNY